MKRLFLAHKKSISEEELVVLKAKVGQLAAQQIQETVEVVSGVDDWEANFERSGGWDGWAQDVVHRCNPMTGRAVYAGIIVPVEGRPARVGKATADIIEAALAKPLPVRVFLSAEGLFYPITGTRAVGTKPRFVDGWELVVKTTP